MARWIEIRGSGTGEPMWRWVGARLAILLSLVFWMGCGAAGEPPSPRPDIVLVTLDTLRADSLGSYGYHRDTSPFLDRLAADGLRFSRAYSVSSWTVPAMASLMTGLHPESHGVTHGLVQEGAVLGQEVLAAEFDLLAEILQRQGYRTFAVIASLHLASEFGFAQGFDRFENLGFVNSPKVLPVLEGMREDIRGADGPVFVWVHLFDPHDPYQPRRPWIRDYFPQPGELRRAGFSSPRELRKHRAVSTVPPDPAVEEVAEFARAAYDSEINFTDRAVAKIFEVLEVSVSDLVVVTSDHGEEFLEHRDFGHAGTLFEEQVRIPLIVRLPQGAHAGRVIEEPVSLLDVLPSLLDYLAIDPPPSVSGRSFLAAVSGEESPPRSVYLSLSRPDAELRGILAGDWKLIRDHREADALQLFDLGNDPAEQADRSADHPEKAAQLARELSHHLAAVESTRPRTALEEVSPETLEQLRALGYVD
jgi:arylsulfatase A-like enzyme